MMLRWLFHGGTVSPGRKDMLIPCSVPICMSPICDYLRVSDKPSTRTHFSVTPILKPWIAGLGGRCGTLGFIAREFPLLPLFHSVEELAVIFLSCVQELSYIDARL